MSEGGSAQGVPSVHTDIDVYIGTHLYTCVYMRVCAYVYANGCTPTRMHLCIHMYVCRVVEVNVGEDGRCIRL